MLYVLVELCYIQRAKNQKDFSIVKMNQLTSILVISLYKNESVRIVTKIQYILNLRLVILKYAAYCQQASGISSDATNILLA